jgi:HSP20 family protein
MEGLTMTLMKRSQNWYPTFPSFFDKFFEGNLMDWNNSNFSSTDTTLPAVNVKENNDAFMIEVAAPGMTKEDFNLNYDNGRLTISSERKNEKKDEGENYTRREFSYQSFQRSFTVPENVISGDKISANYKDGILIINLPKREEVKPKPSREIKIS